jgi:hypothetical protein
MTCPYITNQKEFPIRIPLIPMSVSNRCVKRETAKNSGVVRYNCKISAPVFIIAFDMIYLLTAIG